MAYETDSNNLVSQYGPRSVPPDSGLAGEQSVHGDETRLIYDFSYNNLPGKSSNAMVPVIPLNSLFLSARAEVIEAFTGGTNLAVSLVKASDGTAVSSSTLMTTTDLGSTPLGTAGNQIVGSGSALNTAPATVNSQVKVAATGTFTAGRLRLEINYRQPTVNPNAEGNQV